MQTVIKKYSVPALIILMGAALVCAAFWPLAGTEWADGFRLSTTSVAEGEDGMGGIVMIIGPLIKVMLLIGIGVLLTTIGRRLARLKR